MFLITNLCLCVFSVVILIAIRVSISGTTENDTLNSKLYTSFLYMTIFLLVADLLSRFDGMACPICIYLNYIGNFLMFLLNPVLPVAWLLYVHNVVFCDDNKTIRFGNPFIMLLAVNAAFTVVSQYNGWYYYIDASNVYHRGVLFFLPSALDLVTMLATFALMIAYRKRIEKKYYNALLFFGFPPLICIILQVFIYGIAFALNGIAVSLIIMFINTQNRRMNIDYLTGVFNRKQLDYYIADKIRGSSSAKSFSAILLDLDNFKSINDSLGHQVGDEALRAVVAILKKCTRRTDFIARYGGDEFYIVMDISDHDAVLGVIKRINESISEHNNNRSPYKLSLSLGYLIYDVKERISVEEFQERIDRLMYSNKMANRTIFQQMAFEY